MQKKILILGGGGFIGWNLAKYLLNQTDSVVHLADNFSRKTKTNLFENYENLKVFECNLLDTESYDNFGKPCNFGKSRKSSNFWES